MVYLTYIFCNIPNRPFNHYKYLVMGCWMNEWMNGLGWSEVAPQNWKLNYILKEQVLKNYLFYYNLVIKITQYGAKLSRFKSWFWHLLALGELLHFSVPQVSHPLNKDNKTPFFLASHFEDYRMNLVASWHIVNPYTTVAVITLAIKVINDSCKRSRNTGKSAGVPLSTPAFLPHRCCHCYWFSKHTFRTFMNIKCIQQHIWNHTIYSVLQVFL